MEKSGRLLESESTDNFLLPEAAHLFVWISRANSH
jgi:hypothetical protein